MRSSRSIVRLSISQRTIGWAQSDIATGRQSGTAGRANRALKFRRQRISMRRQGFQTVTMGMAEPSLADGSNILRRQGNNKTPSGWMISEQTTTTPFAKTTLGMVNGPGGADSGLRELSGNSGWAVSRNGQTGLASGW